MEDIVFVTIDCWRYDAPERMPQLSSMFPEAPRRSVICASAATYGAFPALFGSRYHPELYDVNGMIPADTPTLPGILQERGYTTMGVVAANPFLGKWSQYFDKWWNDGMSIGGVEGHKNEKTIAFPTKLRRFLQLRPYVPAEDVISKADDWWERHSSPRFLWIHLMEPHTQFLPGFQRGADIGLFRSYLATGLNYSLTGDVPNWARRHLKELHFQCVERLDSILVPWLRTKDDALLIVTGDHGEEFDHGIIRHARLYDETVRVPLYTNRSIGSLTDSEFVRQLDLSPTLLDHLDMQIPNRWEGTIAPNEMPPQLMVNSAPRMERSWVGVRSERWKVIQPFDWDQGLLQSEAYDLENDPNEVNPIPESQVPVEIRHTLDSFQRRPQIYGELTREGVPQSGFNSEVATRLKELGYLQ